MKNTQETFYHVTALSNFVRGYDKYSGTYSKIGIPQSTFPGQFFVLKPEELEIGLTKTKRLIEKLGLNGDKPIVLATTLDPSELHNDHASGVAQYVAQNHIALTGQFFIGDDLTLNPVRTEDATAQSFEIINDSLIPWQQIDPRSISVLPIALACQASCKFCFSKASVSSQFERFISDWDRVTDVLDQSKQAGAERAVITGGGEPTLLKHSQMTRLITECSERFNKVVLITNGHIYGRLDEAQRLERLQDLDKAGLSVLALSRHHHDRAINAEIMGLDTRVEEVAQSLREARGVLTNIAPRFICVLQQEGVASVQDIEYYLTWSGEQGIKQVNFKELYVSTSNESAFSDLAANAYSAEHQVPLSIVHDFALKHRWDKVAQLPWGAPIYQGNINGHDMQIAAYTEPSVYWERTNGVARSWNLMSDGTVLASLEDPDSEVLVP